MSGIFRAWLVFAMVSFAGVPLLGCATTASTPASGGDNSQVHKELEGIGSAYDSCINFLGADNAQCKAFANAIHQIYEQVQGAGNSAMP